MAYYWLLDQRVWLTQIVRLRGFKWLDKPLATLLLLEPRYLSNRVRIQRLKAPPVSVWWLRRWLWSQDSSPLTSSIILLLIAVDLVLLSYVIGTVFLPSSNPVSGTISWVSPDLISVTGFVGAVLGSMQALIVFAVQLRSSQNTNALPVSTFFSRKYHAHEILALASGIALANIIVVHTGPLLAGSSHAHDAWQSIYLPMLIINIISISAMLMLNIWILANIVADANESDVEAVLPVFAHAMSVVRTGRSRVAMLQQLYLIEVATNKFSYNPLAGISKDGKAIGLGLEGVLRDLDCSLLMRARDYSERIQVLESVEFLVAIGDELKPDAGLWTRLDRNQLKSIELDEDEEASKAGGRERHSSDIRKTTTRVVENHNITKIEKCGEWVTMLRLIRRACVIGEFGISHDRDVQNFFAGLSRSLCSLAREARIVELRERLSELEKLLGVWLDLLPDNYELPSRIDMLVYRDKYFLGPLSVELYDVVDQAVQSKDQWAVEVVLEGAWHLANTSFNHEQAAIAGQYLGYGGYLYRQCQRNEELALAVGKQLDGQVGSLISMKLTRSHNSTDPNEIEKLYSIMRYIMSLIDAAIQFAQIEHAENFADRIFRYLEYPQHQINSENARVQISPRSVVGYIAVLLVGWSIELLVKKPNTHKAVAQKVMQTARKHLPEQEILIAYWELFNQESKGYEREIDWKMGVARWDVAEWDRVWRSGISQSVGGGRGAWIRTGFYASLLMSKSRSWIKLDQVCPNAIPKRSLWNPESTEIALRELSGQEGVGIPKDNIDEKITSIVGMVRQRARIAESKHLEYVLEADLDQKRLSDFQVEARGEYIQQQAWHDAFHSLGLANVEAKAWPFITRRALLVPREALLAETSYVSTSGGILGHITSQWESIRLVGAVEGVGVDAQPIDRLDEIESVVRNQIELMRRRGSEPNVIILPRDERFVTALFRKPSWQIEGRRGHGEASIGDWEGIHVIQFPYTDPQSILILDSRQALGETGVRIEQAEIEIQDHPDDKDILQKWREAQMALDDSEKPLPDSGTIDVLAKMAMPPRIGIVDPTAICRIPIDDTDVCFVIEENTKIYHRPGCAQIPEGVPTQRFVSVIGQLEYTACPVCQPDEWGEEVLNRG